KADHALCQPLRLTKPSRPCGNLPVWRKAIERARIVNGSGNAGRAAGFGKRVAPLGDDRVLSPDRCRSRHQLGHLDDRAETFGVALSALLAGRHLSWKLAKLLGQAGGPDRVSTALSS